tara:strand:+ start:667 stop:957 length:291 start_codon:yes stop_codon:yes gene_type:complete
MADSKAKIKASFTSPDHKIVNGEKIDLTDKEAEALLDVWTDNEHARQVDEEANGYKKSRQKEYPSIADQLDDIYHNGIDAWKETIKATKDKYPKPS